MAGMTSEPMRSCLMIAVGLACMVQLCRREGERGSWPDPRQLHSRQDCSRICSIGERDAVVGHLNLFNSIS